MSRSNGAKSLDARTVLLERRADLVRSRLMLKIDALDTRRRQVMELGHRAQALALPAGATFVAIAAVVAGGTLALRFAVRRRRPRRDLASRLGRLLNALRGPTKPPLFAELGRKVLVTVVTIVVGSVARRAMKNFVDGRVPDGRLVAAKALER